MTIHNVDRRVFFGRSGQIALSATAIGLLAGCSARAASSGAATASAAGSTEADVGILNVALGLEHEAIAAYQVGAESGLLSQPVLDAAVLFQGHHKAHRDTLTGIINQMGGTPVPAASNADYAAALNAGSLQTETDVLRLALELEEGAANAYLGVIPSFSDPDLAQASGRLAADETMHWTVLASVLGEPLPTEALTFGA